MRIAVVGAGPAGAALALLLAQIAADSFEKTIQQTTKVMRVKMTRPKIVSGFNTRLLHRRKHARWIDSTCPRMQQIGVTSKHRHKVS